MKHSNLIRLTCCFCLLSLLYGCKKEVLEEVKSDPEASFSTQAKNWLQQQNSFLEKDDLYLEKDHTRRRLTLRWQEAFAYHHKNHDMLMVPLRGDTADANPAIAVVFSRNNKGEIGAVIKQMNVMGQQRLSKPAAYMETMYGLNGELLAAYVKEGNNFKRLHFSNNLNPALQRASGGCSIYYTEYIQVNCQITECSFRRFSTYSYTGCDGSSHGDQPNSEDSWPEHNDGAGDYTEYIGPFDEDEEVYNPEDTVSLKKMFNCFNQIPDAGATYSITLYVDVPVNNKPLVPFTLSGNPGHTFIRLSKFGSGQAIHQVFGFYPSSGRKSALTLQAVNSEIHNDALSIEAGHEFNAKYELFNISATQFNAVIQLAQHEAAKQYELDNYNCSHFATALMNVCLPPGEKLFGIAYQLHHPILQAPVLFTNSPTGLYTLMAHLKSNGGPQANRITVDVVEKATKSNGPCN